MIDILAEAERLGVGVEYMSLPCNKALAVRNAGEEYVCVDYSLPLAAERACVAHELGHCATGALYAMYAPAEVRRRCETRALRWAIKRLVPFDILKSSAKRCNDIFEIAENLDVPVYFLIQAVYYYTEILGLSLEERK